MSDLPPIRNRHWLEYAATALVLAISVISLWVAIKTEDANDRMVAASSWPFLQIDSSNADDEGNPKIILSLVNAGVGPAKVETFEVFWKGKAFRTSTELLKACCIPANPAFHGSWSTETGSVSSVVIRAGETRHFLTFPHVAGNLAIWDAFDRVRFSQMSYRACYCSVFDECWLSDLKGLRPARVDKCPVPKVAYSE